MIDREQARRDAELNLTDVVAISDPDSFRLARHCIDLLDELERAEEEHDMELDKARQQRDEAEVRANTAITQLAQEREASELREIEARHVARRLRAERDRALRSDPRE